MGTKCPLCLSDNPDQSKFCAECGTKLSSLEDAQLTRTLTPNTALKGLTKGKVFAGKYMILDEIGRGGMGVVLEAKDMRLKRTVALKFLPLELSQYEEAKARFIREAQAAAALSHPNICTVHEVEEADGQPYIAMEYVQGRTLRQLAAKGPLDVDTVTDLSVQVASGLEAAHQRGIVHRDIKSANIMVTDKGQAKIMDFGLAKVAGELQITKVAGTMGTVAYMSPEQAQGEDLDRRTDIWSFGVVLYEMLTGQLPFRGERDSIVLHSITGAEPKPLRQIKADIPAELQKIIDRALKKKREERYASAAEMAADLRAYLERRRAEEAGFFNLRSLARRMRKPAYFIPAAAVLVALGFLTYSFIQRNAHVRWAREIALPQVEKSIQADNFTAAYTLAKEAAKYIPKDPDLSDALGQVTAFATVSTYPPGAQFFVKDYKTLEDDYEFIGLTPLDKVPYPNGYKRWKIVKDGYEPVEGAGYDLSGIKAKLDVKGSLPPGMVRIQPSAEFEAPLDGTEKLPAVRLEEYLLDRYEVTNRRYKEFMDAGGYRRPEFWKEKFVRDGKEIPWTEAIKSFVDKTGRLGPATWEFGAYPNEQDDYPVSGVSWYEAAAYAEFAGKSLPTIYHWRWAAGDPGSPALFDAGYMIPLSNFGDKGPNPVGQMQGLSVMGIYNMAGNVKEWCRNETEDRKKANLGGGWGEPAYMFISLDRYPAWFRLPNFGFRCMKYLTTVPADAVAAKTVPLAPEFRLGKLNPCSDEVFQNYLRLYVYTKTSLNARIERKEDLTPYTTLETVSFDAPYVGGRAGAYLFIPRQGKGPFQTVIHWPGADAQFVGSIDEYWSREGPDLYTKTGRAWVVPILINTFGRQWNQDFLDRTTRVERNIMQAKDFMRTVDYLETRPELDATKLAYEGLSWGGNMGPWISAVEKRIRAIVLLGPSLVTDRPQETNQVNFAPRVTVPVLILSGRYDFLASMRGNLELLRGLFGTAPGDKIIKTYESGHAVWALMQARRDEFDFLDKYLGPAK